MKRAVVMVGVALLMWTLGDIATWQRGFEAHGWDHIPAIGDPYQTGHQLGLAGLLIVAVIGARGWWSIWVAAALPTLAYSGLPDALYYLLDRRPLPAELPWLDDGYALHHLILFHPVTSTSLVLSMLFWLGFWAASLLILRARALQPLREAKGSIRARSTRRLRTLAGRYPADRARVYEHLEDALAALDVARDAVHGALIASGYPHVRVKDGAEKKEATLAPTGVA